MSIRPATVRDALAIARVHVLTWQHAYRDLLPEELLAKSSVAERQRMWTSSLSVAVLTVLVAEMHDEIVGFAACGRCQDKGAPGTDRELWALYVEPSHWSTGVGRQLWLRSREAMVGQAATRIILWVLAYNERAIRFYTAAGFRPEPDSIKTETVGGVAVDEIRYVVPDASPTG